MSAVVYTGKHGVRKDGLYYASAGIHPDCQIVTINGTVVSAEEYLYWLAYDCEYLSYYVSGIDWNAEISEGMATDYATSPVTKKGQIIFGIGCGLMTCFIRRFGSYPEGVCYSILVMNCTTWLLDKYIRPTIYGAPKKEKKEAAAK